MCHFFVSSTTLFTFLPSSWCFVLIKSFLISCFFLKKKTKKCVLFESLTHDLTLKLFVFHCIWLDLILVHFLWIQQLSCYIPSYHHHKTISLNLFSELCGVSSWWGIEPPNPHKFVKFLGIFNLEGEIWKFMMKML